MRILLLGGTRYFGRSLAYELIRRGHELTIATRGIARDGFGRSVKRVTVERSDRDSLFAALYGSGYDCVFDNICYAPDDLCALLDIVGTDRYIFTSSTSVYSGGLAITESDFDPMTCTLKSGQRGDFTYAEGKRMCEAALFQRYPGLSAAAVRFPVVLGPNDYTCRLKSYVDNIMSGTPMYIDDADSRQSFIFESEAARFLASMADNGITGPVHAASEGTTSIREIIRYIEDRSGVRAILAPNAIPGALNGFPDCTLDKEKARSDGFLFVPVELWLWRLLDTYIDAYQAAFQ